jgi:hypothetical protein
MCIKVGHDDEALASLGKAIELELGAAVSY